jgi:hypothetical protein
MRLTHSLKGAWFQPVEAYQARSWFPHSLKPPGFEPLEAYHAREELVFTQLVCFFHKCNLVYRYVQDSVRDFRREALLLGGACTSRMQSTHSLKPPGFNPC